MPRVSDAAILVEGLAKRFGPVVALDGVDFQAPAGSILRLIGRLTQLRESSVEARAAEVLQRFGLADAADRPVRTYSGGMRRRLDVAAAPLQRPQVLFFDEPTTGLDPQSR